MHFLDPYGKPTVFAGIAAASLMLLTGLTFVGTAVALAIMMPVFVFFSPILVPAVITSGFLATGLLASGSLGATAIAILVWLYKKEENFRYNLHARGVQAQQPKGAKRPKGTKSGNISGGNKPPGELKPLGRDKPLEEIKMPGRDKPSVEDNPSEREKPTNENKPLGQVKHAEEEPSSIHEILEVLLEEHKPIGPKRCGPNTSTTKRSHQFRLAVDSSKARSVFAKEYQKLPRVGALAYKNFTSRDKKNT